MYESSMIGGGVFLENEIYFSQIVKEECSLDCGLIADCHEVALLKDLYKMHKTLLKWVCSTF